jgi:hypothetical protein
MKTFNEKEEKLNSSLQKLKKLKFENPQLTEQTKNLKAQKNQLEIEKTSKRRKGRQCEVILLDYAYSISLH